MSPQGLNDGSDGVPGAVPAQSESVVRVCSEPGIRPPSHHDAGSGQAGPKCQSLSSQAPGLGRDPAQLAQESPSALASIIGFRVMMPVPVGPGPQVGFHPGRLGLSCQARAARRRPGLHVSNFTLPVCHEQSEFTGNLKPEFRLNIRVSTATESTVT